MYVLIEHWKPNEGFVLADFFLKSLTKAVYLGQLKFNKPNWRLFKLQSNHLTYEFERKFEKDYKNVE